MAVVGVFLVPVVAFAVLLATGLGRDPRALPSELVGRTAPTFDLVNDPASGVGGNDFSEFLHLFYDCGIYLTRIDYNCDGQITGDDFSSFLQVFYDGLSAVNCPPGKDPNLGPKCP